MSTLLEAIDILMRLAAIIFLASGAFAVVLFNLDRKQRREERRKEEEIENFLNKENNSNTYTVIDGKEEWEWDLN